ncbi:MAG: hypothetical protein H7837_09535 [Magnetococcus sp. MYC-9]
MIPYRTPLLCCALLMVSLPGVARALSLGELQMVSAPGQPLQASADLQLEENEMIRSIKIGSNSDYALVNIPRPAIANQITVQIKQQGDDTSVWLQSDRAIRGEAAIILLHITSNQRTYLPFFRVQPAPETAATVALPPGNPGPKATSSPVRQTATFVDPRPGRHTVEQIKPFDPMAGAEMAAVTRASTPERLPALRESRAADPTPGPSTAPPQKAAAPPPPPEAPGEEPVIPVQGVPEPAPVLRSTRPSRLPQTAMAEPDQAQPYGPVRSGETLAAIARPAAKAAAVGVHQAEVAIWQSNPEQFTRNNMNGLKRGGMLLIPPPTVMAQVDLRQASRLREEHIGAWKQETALLKTDHLPRVQAHTGVTPVVPPPGRAKELPRAVLPTLASAPPQPSLATRPALPPGQTGKTVAEPLERIANQLQTIHHLMEKSQSQLDLLLQRIAALESSQESFKQFDQRLTILEGRGGR